MRDTHGTEARLCSAAFRISGLHCLCARSLCKPGGSAAARTQSRNFGCRGRRAGFGDADREWHYVIGLLGAEDSLAASQLGFATGDARRIVGCHLGAAYDAERGQHHQNRSTAPEANKRRVLSNDRKPVDL
jgi:hypothetical protein